MMSGEERKNAGSAEMDGKVLPSGRIYVCPLSAVPVMVEEHGASHLITLINHDTMPETPQSITARNHLKLGMNDINEPSPGLVLPNETHVADLIEFTEKWERTAPMIIHCWAGISRSTAAAFVSLCLLNPKNDEEEIAQHMRRLSPTAYPNRRLVDIADALLERGGRMNAAVKAIGRGEMASEGVIFGMTADLAE